MTPYILKGDERHLSISAFTDAQKLAAFERQKGECPFCGKAFTLEAMEADRITSLLQGVKTAAANCQMLCKTINRAKGTDSNLCVKELSKFKENKVNKLMVCAIVIIAGVAITSGAPSLLNGRSMRLTGDIDELTAERRAQEKVESSKKRLDKLYSLTNKIETLSGDAQSVFRERIIKSRTDYCAATNELAKIQAKLTPEHRAELEAAKKATEVKRKADEEVMARLEKLNVEVDAFENKSEEEGKMDAAERRENERLRVLKESREREAAKRVSEREELAAKQVAEREELARKRAAAQEELAGWPMPFSPRSFWKVSVYGTNVGEVVRRCCEGTHVNANSFRLDSGSTSAELISICSKAFNVVFPAETREDASNQVWEANGSACLIEEEFPRGAPRLMGYNSYAKEIWKKYDASGRLVKCGNRAKFEEYVWITNQHAIISAKLREEWAKKYGLKMEKAEDRAKELIEVIHRLWRF